MSALLKRLFTDSCLFFFCYVFFSLAPRLVLPSANETFSQGTFIIHSTSSGRTCVTATASHTTAALPEKSAFNNSCSDSVSFPLLLSLPRVTNASPSHLTFSRDPAQSPRHTKKQVQII